MRIVSLLPGATEILCALGLHDHLIAISHECDYPPSVQNLPRVSSTLLSSELSAAEIDQQVSQAHASGVQLNVLDVSLLNDLQADLVVSQNLCDVCAIDASAQPLASSLSDKVPALISLDGTDFDGILNDIRQLGEASFRSLQAQQLCASLASRWRAPQPPMITQPPRVLFVEWSDPGYYAGHWVPQMISRAGGHNLFGVAGERSGVFEWSQARAEKPDVIVFGCCGFDLQRNVELARSFAVTADGKHMLSTAQGGLWAVDANGFFSRPGPRVVDGMQTMADLLRGRPVTGISARVAIE